MNAIEVNDLDKRFGDTIALDGLSFRVTEGEIFALVGPDGAGKSTTMRMLAGIMAPTAGSATVLGFDTVREAEAIKERIGYMSQRFGLYPDLSVEENLHFYADIYGVPRKGRGEKTDRLLAFSNMGPFKKRLAGNLSGGMKQKLGLACALIHTPRVLLLDEPTNGVDPVSRRDFWRILYQLLKQGVTIVVSTAYLDEAERATRVGLLHQGSLLAVDTPEGLKGLIAGDLLEVRAERPRATAAALRTALPGCAVTLFGERVHVVSDDPETTGRTIKATLDREGLALVSVQPGAPSLEDVFVSVLAHENPEVAHARTH
jgi:ABC-2 type transport system ATP-binding protein